MKQQSKKKAEIEIGDQPLRELVNTSWNFAYTSLWNDTSFSQKEINAAKDWIEVFITLSSSRQKAFSSFCQRVFLTKQYLDGSPYHFVPTPAEWLNPSNKNGFAGTRDWLKKIEARRLSVPRYREEVKAIPEAILEMIQHPTKANFRYWKNYFAERHCPDLLNLFLNNIANAQYQ